MDKQPLMTMTWKGRETVQTVSRLLGAVERIEIKLPRNYNHALYRAVNPQAPPAQIESLSTAAGPELLANIASIAGLEALADLDEALHSANASLELRSPPTLIIDLRDAH